MGRPVVPVGQIARRLPTGGRIRIGVKSGRAMKALDTFRFTSPDPAALGQVAELYGGAVKEWKEPKAAPGQFELFTDASEIRIALPPDPLGGTPMYELWGGGGRQRYCDGETCEMLVQGTDGIDMQHAPCLCIAKEELACKLITRLSVLLPEIRFVGVWRIDTKSQNAAEELPGMVDLIRSLQDRGIVKGLLRIESRRQVVAGETRQFKVPVLGVDESIEALAAGAGRMGSALGTGSVPVAGELEAGEAGDGDVPGVGPDAEPLPSRTDDDDVIDAEIVGDDRTLADVLPVGVSEGRALAVARRLSGESFTACDQVHDYKLVAAVLDEVTGEEVHA